MDGGGFDRVHLYLPLANDYAKKFDVRGIKDTFHQFQGMSVFVKM